MIWCFDYYMFLSAGYFYSRHLRFALVWEKTLYKENESFETSHEARKRYRDNALVLRLLLRRDVSWSMSNSLCMIAVASIILYSLQLHYFFLYLLVSWVACCFHPRVLCQVFLEVMGLEKEIFLWGFDKNFIKVGQKMIPELSQVVSLS